MKAKLFHAGRGMWEVRYKKKTGGRIGIFGAGYFYRKKAAQNIIKRINKYGLP